MRRAREGGLYVVGCQKIGHTAASCMENLNSTGEEKSAELLPESVEAQSGVKMGESEIETGILHEFRDRLSVLMGREIGASLLSPEVQRVLPTVDVWVSGTRRRALVDSGCSKSISYVNLMTSWVRQKRNLETLGGFQYVYAGNGRCEIILKSGDEASVDVLVCNKKPLGFDIILGMDAIRQLGGDWVGDRANVWFGVETHCAAGGVVGNGVKRVDSRTTKAEPSTSQLVVEAKDYVAKYDETRNCWCVKWKWVDGVVPPLLKNTVGEYRIPDSLRKAYDEEAESWIRQGWLLPHDKGKHGPLGDSFHSWLCLNHRRIRHAQS